MEQQKILIDNRKKKKIQTDTIRQKTKQILNVLGFDDHEISIVITDDRQIRTLNRTYRNQDRPTNVLSFPMQEGEFGDINPGLLGDVVISWESAHREAVSSKIDLRERISQLLVHGILHLVGFDHEKNPMENKKMENKSIELLRKIEKNKNLNAF